MVAPSVPVPPASVPLLLTFNGGYVDTAGFLAIQGLFTAHVTGNFVTIGAALVAGTAGVLTKLLALPVFCLSVLLCRLIARQSERRGRAVLHRLLRLHLLLLSAGSAAAVWALPARAVDEWTAASAGLLLVAAMAVQNGLHRMHMGGTPPSTLMTGTTTQIMTDLGDLLNSNAAPAVSARIRAMSIQVGVFAAGCAAAALAYALAGPWCFLIPPMVAVLALLRLGPAPAGTPATGS